MVNNFEDLTVWQEAHRLTVLVYKITMNFPKEEQFGLISQIRRAIVSVENNIAEGFGRRTHKDFANFLYTSLGSLFEVRSMVRLSKELNFMVENDHDFLLGQILILQKRLKSLISKLQESVR